MRWHPPACHVLLPPLQAPNSKLEDVLDDCQDTWNQHQVKDETKDKTSWLSGGELEVDDVECQYVEANKMVFFDKSDAKKAATTPQPSPAPAAKSAAGAVLVPAAAVLAAAAAGALLL